MDSERRKADRADNEELANEGWLATRKVAKFAAAAILILWLACLVMAVSAWKQNASAEIGQFGDAFGSVNALFSGLALTAVAATLVLTASQLHLQQRELIQNTDALHDHTEEFQKQLALSRQQSTTGNVFQLLGAFREIGERVHADGKRSDEAFQKLAEDVRELEVAVDGPLRHLINSAFMAVHHSHEYPLNHYFRMLYQIVRFIDEIEGLDLSQRFGFIRIVRAHLSQAELELIMYNSLTPEGNKFHPLLEKYDLLQNLNTERIKYRELVTCFPIHCSRSIERLMHGESSSWSDFAEGALFDEQLYGGWSDGRWIEGSLYEHTNRFQESFGFDAVGKDAIAKLMQFSG